MYPDRGSLIWHTEAAWPAQPALATLQYGGQLPNNGGHIMIAGMISARGA